jgi:ubiquinone/menaquinone biosynthesis C-methylase UbiE
VLIEIGCGKGHFLRRIRQISSVRRSLVGIDVSRAIYSLPPHELMGVQADGEFLPFRSGCAQCVVYDGALHHMIDYPTALREAIRLLEPGGLLLIFEPTTSWFSQLAHRLLDPIVFRKVVYESPVDIHYKKHFHFKRIISVLRESEMEFEVHHSEFLAYPFTGCYASSFFARSERFMQALMTIEDWIEALPLVRSIARTFSWRFTVVATKSVASNAQTQRS